MIGGREDAEHGTGNRGQSRGIAGKVEPEPAAQPTVDALWRGVEARIARRSWRTRLAELPTAARVGVALAIAATVTATAALAFGIRSGMPAMRVAVALGALALAAAACFAVSLRGVDRRPLGRWAWAVVGLAIALPFALALWPGAADGHEAGASCLWVGLAVGALVSVPVFLAQRGSVPVWARAAAAVAGGGAGGYAVLELHCPSRDVTHLLIGHALVGVVLVIAALVGVAVGRRRG